MANLHNPFDGLTLDEEEALIEQAIENGEYQDVANFEDSRKMAAAAARQYAQLNATKPITLRVKQADLIKIKAKAKRNNMPYQTLLGSVLHDFAEGNRGLTIK
jgi:predicted DNA binding CopG/RHH family protein